MRKDWKINWTSHEKTGSKFADIFRTYEATVADAPDSARRPTPKLMQQGYRHENYAHALTALGQPLFLRRSKGWLFRRSVPDSEYADLVGPYPFLSCEKWDQLAYDLDDLGDGLVSIACVLDPYGHYAIDQLKSVFPDICIPFKTHYWIDLPAYEETAVAHNHRRNAKKAKTVLDIRRVADPQGVLDTWCELYQQLIRKHAINGVTRFSRASFQAQLAVPGACLFEARYKGTAAGMAWFYIQDESVHYHLAAYNTIGYQLGASFGIFYDAIRYFKSLGLRQLCLGGGSGLKENSGDGLIRFKQGWSNGKRMVWFCGKIIDSEKYQWLVRRTNIRGNSFFPAYRVDLSRNTIHASKSSQ